MRTNILKGKALDTINSFIQSATEYGSQLEAWIGIYKLNIAQACDPQINHSPNLGLNMEICDLVNKNLKT